MPYDGMKRLPSSCWYYMKARHDRKVLAVLVTTNQQCLSPDIAQQNQKHTRNPRTDRERDGNGPNDERMHTTTTLSGLGGNFNMKSGAWSLNRTELRL